MARRLASWLALLCLAACGAAPSEPAGGIAVRVAGLALDDNADSPVVILQEIDGPRRLPIWIGLAEAQSIAVGLGGHVPLRPNAHDLGKRLIQGLDGRVERVVVIALRDGIYYARIDLVRDGHTVSIDARPSDAIALALRLDAPIFVHEALFESSIPELPPSGSEVRGHAPERQVEAWSL
jgi:uncharacterized protein